MGINAGKYNRQITIYKIVTDRDDEGFQEKRQLIILKPYANVKTTKGFVLIANNSDFEKAYTNFTIRYSRTVVDAYYDASDSNRDLMIAYKGKTYIVQYLNNINEQDVELEMQAKEVLK